MSSLALSTHMRVMAAVLELAALKVIPEADTQPGFSHRFTTKLAQAQGHGDLFRARFNIPVLTFSFTFTLKRRALVTLPGLGLTRFGELTLGPRRKGQ